MREHKPTMRWNRISGILAAGVFFLLVLFLISKLKFEIPEENVTGITVQIFNHPYGGTNIQDFEIPKSDFKGVLDLLDGAGPHYRLAISPIDWPYIGNLKITTTSGDRHLQLFAAKDALIFDVKDGGRYKAEVLREIISTIEASAKGTPDT